MADSTNSIDGAPQAGDGVEISAPRARQGYRGRRILWILLASLAAVIAAFVVAFTTNSTAPVSDKAGGGGAIDPAAAAAFNTPAPASKPPA